MKQFPTQPLKHSAVSTAWRIISLGALLVLISACGTPKAQVNSLSPTATGNPAFTISPMPTTGSTAGTIKGPFQASPGADEAIRECGDCFTPEQLQTYYDFASLYAEGYTGEGVTIAIIDSIGSPTIQQDLHTFDQTFGLPDPPQFQILTPLGAPTPTQISSAWAGWPGETTLDVEWAHAMAPGANIVLLVSPEDIPAGIQGFPQYEQLFTYAMDHHLGQVFSLSLVGSEPTFIGDPCNEGLGDGQTFLTNFDQKVFQRAVTEHITMLAATGDDGATTRDCNNNLYPYQSVNWPASDPLVTAVGGTDTNWQADGSYGGEYAWGGAIGGTGGGRSQIFTEPTWQKSLPDQSQLQGYRSIPDVAAAAVGYPYYHTYPGDASGWYRAAGTSASTPLWAGLVAIADQVAGHSLGFLNPALYQLAGKGLHDVTTGDNSAQYTGVSGFTAGLGWDMATGWGTPDAAVFIPLLIQTIQTMNG